MTPLSYTIFAKASGLTDCRSKLWKLDAMQLSLELPSVDPFKKLSKCEAKLWHENIRLMATQTSGEKTHRLDVNENPVSIMG